MTAAAILQVVTPFGRGSACFVGNDLVLTAGHVLHPHTPTPVAAALIHVTLPDGTVIRPSATLAHPRWSTGFNVDADMALLRVAVPHASLVLPTTIDRDAVGLATQVRGFAAANQLVTATGTVDRIAHPGGFDALISSDLAFPSGVSGAPMFDPGGSVFGIATWSSPVPTASSLVGIPLTEVTFTWLRTNFL